MVLAALELAPALETFKQQNEGKSASEFEQAWQVFLAQVQGSL
jgi:hypothetical protein